MRVIAYSQDDAMHIAQVLDEELIRYKLEPSRSLGPGGRMYKIWCFEFATDEFDWIKSRIERVTDDHPLICVV